MTDLPDVTSPHAQLWLELKDADWRQFLHHPLMSAYQNFMEDQIAVWREIAADLVEIGAFTRNDGHEDRSPDVVRGKILALKQLHRISLEDIQSFYGKDSAGSDT